MCGIVGFSGKIKLDKFLESLKSLSHRGPDDNGKFIDIKKELFFGQTRLSIIELSEKGHQPMLSEDGNFVIIFNGEIYNYKKLRRKLIDRGLKFDSFSDTEVLLKLFQVEGKKMLNLLNGIFAFAIWNKSENTIFVARDAFGVKPLYYCDENNNFAFSSELKSLIYLLNWKVKLNFLSLKKYINYLWCPGNETIVKKVKKLGPGEMLYIKSGKIIEHENWYKLPIFRVAQINYKQNEAVNLTIKYLKQAVKRQLVADVEVGAFLSGGLDSSSIVTFAKQYNSNIRCFTIDSDLSKEDGVTDDLPYAKKVAKHLGVSLEIVKVNSKMIINDIQKMVWQLDEPIADPASLNVFYISELAKQNGLKVLLSGAGGDDIFSGYRRHDALIYDYFLKKLPQKSLSLIENTTNLLNQNNHHFRKLKKFFYCISKNHNHRLAGFFSWFNEKDLNNLFSEEVQNLLLDEYTNQPLINFLNKVDNKKSSLNKMLALEQRFFLTDHNLNYTDKMSMSQGVEVRVPFLDPELVDFASSVPDNLKQKYFQSKWILKKSMENYLPKEIIYRKKTGFGVPLRRWIKKDLREMISDYLSPKSIKERGIFDATNIQNLITNNDKGYVDGSYTIFSLLCIEIWCRKYLDTRDGL